MVTFLWVCVILRSLVFLPETSLVLCALSVKSQNLYHIPTAWKTVHGLSSFHPSYNLFFCFSWVLHFFMSFLFISFYVDLVSIFLPRLSFAKYTVYRPILRPKVLWFLNQRVGMSINFSLHKQVLRMIENYTSQIFYYETYCKRNCWQSLRLFDLLWPVPNKLTC